MKTLLEIYNKNKVGDWPDKNSVHSYISVYEEILAPYRHTAKNVLEIGLMSGESLRMWIEYFNNDLRSTHCNVYGMDCDVKPINGLADLTQAINDGLKILIADATSEADIEKYFGNIKWDVLIEDSSHNISDQLKIIEIFKNRMNKGGVIVVEDIQDIDNTRHLFESIPDKKVTVLDRRQIKGRYDDCLVIITDKA